MLPQVKTADQSELSTEKRLRYWVRTLRPLLWWTAFVLFLLAIHTHQQWMERTRLEFSMNMEGQPLPFEATATLDGRQITTGDRLSLGSHTFAITHSKVEPFSTNLFIWYGLKDLGTIPLKRAHGLLEVYVNPPARILDITGPEFTRTLTNSTGMTSSIPTDAYAIVARFAHSEERENVSVASGSPISRRIVPRLGTLVLECNRPEASFELRASDGRLLETGLFPTSVPEVPEGVYTLVSQHHRNRDERPVSAMVGMTNVARVDFVYGTAIFETDPPGAQVMSSEGVEYGETPITLAELRPGHLHFRLQKAGFERLELLLSLAAEGTNFVRTNLISRNYTSSMAAARGLMTTGDYERALQAATDALNSKPGDIAAGELVTKAVPFVRLNRAQILGQHGNYTAAMRELQSVLEAWPADERAQALMGEYKARLQEEAEKAKQAGRIRVRQAFAQALSRQSDSGLFGQHNILTDQKASSVSRAISSALRDQAPAFIIGSNTSPEPDVTVIVAKQELTGAARMCVIVVGQTAFDETEIRYEVLEYKTQAANPFSIGALINMPVEKVYIPLHPAKVGQLTDKMRVQIDEGVVRMTERIQTAIAQIAQSGPKTPEGERLQ